MLWQLFKADDVKLPSSKVSQSLLDLYAHIIYNDCTVKAQLNLRQEGEGW